MFVLAVIVAKTENEFVPFGSAVGFLVFVVATAGYSMFRDVGRFLALDRCFGAGPLDLGHLRRWNVANENIDLG